MRGRRYHRVREGPFPPSGRADDGPQASSVTPPTFESGLPGLIAELKWRGMYHDASEGLEARFATDQPITGYIGFDPTGPWLHIGHLVPIFGLIQLQRRGGRPIALMGGGTGMVGDPSGRSSERNLQSFDAIEANVASMRPQLERMLDFDGPNGASMANNAALAGAHQAAGLPPGRRQALHDPVHALEGLGPDAARAAACRSPSSATCSSRPPTSSTSSGPWTASSRWAARTSGATSPPGLELIRRTTPARDDGAPLAYALAYPLLLMPSGAKFGKSEGGDSVWLHADGTSPYAFYQHWLNTDDRDVGIYLRWFTTFSPEQILALDAATAEAPQKREAQRTLAGDLTARVHGEAAAAAAIAASEAAFAGGPIDDPAVLQTLHRETGGFTFGARDGGDAARRPGRGRHLRVPRRGPADDPERRPVGERRPRHRRRGRRPAAPGGGVARRPRREAQAAHRAARRWLRWAAPPNHPWRRLRPSHRGRLDSGLRGRSGFGWPAIGPIGGSSARTSAASTRSTAGRSAQPVGEALTAFPTGKTQAWISPDGEQVIWHADQAGDEVGHFVATPWSGGDVVDLTPDLPGYASFAAAISADGTFAASIIGPDRVQLAIVPASQPPTLLDPGPGFVTGLALGPDGTIAYSTTAGRGLETVLRTLDGATGEPRLDLDHAPGALRVLAYSDSGRLVASTSRGGAERPIVIEPDGAVRDFPFEDEPGDLTPYDVSADGRTVLIIGAHRTVERLALLDVETGALRTLPGITGDLGSWGGTGTFIRADGKVVVTREDATMLPEVLLVDPADGSVIETLIPATPVPPSRPLRSLDVPTTDGAVAQGWLMTPDGAGPFPTILDIHGGPQGHELDRFDPEAQAWVDRGFAFFTVNYRGSTGFGRAYEQAIWGNVGRYELDDLVAARATLVDLGLADPERVVLNGGSYGGYLTLLGLGRRPDLWAAGVAYVAIADWRLMYEDGESLREYQVALFGGTPDEQPELTTESSPVTYVDSLAAPLLIVQGRNDARCPARQIEGYIARAEALGKDITVDWFDAGHGHGATQTRIDWCRRAIEFVESKLGIVAPPL